MTIAVKARGKAVGSSATGRPKPNASSQNLEEEVARGADDYVRRVMAVEKRFYATHYSESDLTSFVAYLESDVGQATLSRAPAIKQAVARTMQVQLVSVLGNFDSSVCSVVTCTAKQRSELAKFADLLGASLQAFGASAS